MSSRMSFRRKLAIRLKQHIIALEAENKEVPDDKINNIFKKLITIYFENKLDDNAKTAINNIIFRSNSAKYWHSYIKYRKDPRLTHCDENIIQGLSNLGQQSKAKGEDLNKIAVHLEGLKDKQRGNSMSR